VCKNGFAIFFSRFGDKPPLKTPPRLFAQIRVRFPAEPFGGEIFFKAQKSTETET